jgi:hypothetical protein
VTRGTIGLIAAAAAVGIVGGVVLDSRLRTTSSARGGETAPRTEDLAAIVDEIETLSAALDEERSRRTALELELAIMRQEIARKGAAPEVPQTSPAVPDRLEEAAKAIQSETTQKAWFDSDALRERGVDDRHSQFLRERFEALQMEELYLRDQATREGWLNTPRHHREQRQLLEGARATLGDGDFDWLLYASGRPNRVVIHDVLESSPANAAGIEAGDLILRYDDVVVLTPTDLTTATAQGEPGAAVAVEIQRDGDVQRLYLSRGPLGARIGAVRRAPLDAP